MSLQVAAGLSSTPLIPAERELLYMSSRRNIVRRRGVILHAGQKGRIQKRKIMLPERFSLLFLSPALSVECATTHVPAQSHTALSTVHGCVMQRRHPNQRWKGLSRDNFRSDLRHLCWTSL